MESHLLQMRGLKQRERYRSLKITESHLLQMRGLKPFMEVILLYTSYVASFTDAWIETFVFAVPVKAFGRIFYRCVD